MIFNGCAPVPLAHFLKGLGVFRILAEQMDSEVKAAWKNDALVLTCHSDSEAIVGFFLRTYEPTPVVAPWNGGSGFYPKDSDEALKAIEENTVPRFAAYRECVNIVRRELNALGLKAKPDGESKAILLQRCRNTFTESALNWLDAVLVLGQDGPKFPPLLGTGGNDGRLEFTNNFMQRIAEVIETKSGQPTENSERWLRAALFGGTALKTVAKAPVGQFYPGAAGGANATSGFDAPAAVNPWDFILMIEGTLMFAAASVKRLEGVDDGSLVYPFCVRQSGVGYASAAGADEVEARCEMWMPLWSNPTSLSELRALFGEGRAQVRGRAARTGVDFAQAAVTLGVDRGIKAFQRYGFQVRNGLAYFATPLDRVVVRRNAAADLLRDFEPWYDRLRQKAGAKANPKPPASVARALRRVEQSIIDVCRDGSPSVLLEVLASLGAAERALANSSKWSTESYLRPLCGLRKEWIEKVEHGIEFRLACSLAGIKTWAKSEMLLFRQHLEPVSMGIAKGNVWATWADTAGNDVVWMEGDLTGTLNAIMARRAVRFEKAGIHGWPDRSPRPARLSDITAFIEMRTNDALLADLIWGLSLVNWAAPDLKADASENEEDAALIPSSLYALMRLCFRPKQGYEKTIPVNPAILNRAVSGDGVKASELAVRRLRGSGFSPLVESVPVSGELARRMAAALIFPISERDLTLLGKTVLKELNP